jgi:hypothetical protein
MIKYSSEISESVKAIRNLTLLGHWMRWGPFKRLVLLKRVHYYGNTFQQITSATKARNSCWLTCANMIKLYISDKWSICTWEPKHHSQQKPSTHGHFRKYISDTLWLSKKTIPEILQTHGQQKRILDQISPEGRENP